MSWVIQSEEKAKAAGASELDEVLYVTSVGDLLIVYEDVRGEGAWANLSEDEKASLIRRARSYMEGFCGEGSYNFADALKQAIEDEASDKQTGRVFGDEL